jgi:hypothetical protein
MNLQKRVWKSASNRSFLATQGGFPMNKHKMHQRLLSWVLSCVMLLSYIPMTIWVSGGIGRLARFSFSVHYGRAASSPALFTKEDSHKAVSFFASPVGEYE